MTKEEAFNGWWNGGIAHPVDVGYDCAITAWNAACDWQKAQDAALIYTKGDKRYHPWGEHYEEDVREMCAGEIMCS